MKFNQLNKKRICMAVACALVVGGVAVYAGVDGSSDKDNSTASLNAGVSLALNANDIDSIDGSHNGEDYLAYTFYIENMGDDSVNYYYELTIDDVIKNLDEAVRFRIYENGNSITYAKKSRATGKAEINTLPFKNDKTVVLKKVANGFSKLGIEIYR